jgi:hypothetical protein
MHETIARKKFPGPSRTGAGLALLVAVLLGGCVSQYTSGQGDAGAFIMKKAIEYGGRPIATSGLPTIGGDWRYANDKFGVGIELPLESYGAVDTYLRSAFGPPSSHAGWAVRDIGVAIVLQQEGANTEVGIYPPMSETINKNTK